MELAIARAILVLMVFAKSFAHYQLVKTFL
jgi:hypothetical protein